MYPRFSEPSGWHFQLRSCLRSSILTASTFREGSICRFYSSGNGMQQQQTTATDLHTAQAVKASLMIYESLMHLMLQCLHHVGPDLVCPHAHTACLYSTILKMQICSCADAVGMCVYSHYCMVQCDTVAGVDHSHQSCQLLQNGMFPLACLHIQHACIS